MKIIPKTKIVNFNSLKPGDVFKYNEEYLIKIVAFSNKSGIEINAIDLKNGYLNSFENEEVILCDNAQLIFSN